MPHQCVRCNTFYEDGAHEILKGCTCGGRLFFFIKKKHLDEARTMVTNLTSDQKKQIEQDVFDIVGSPYEEEKPVVLDFESIHVVAPGKYQIDIVQLFKKEPLIFKVGDGKYVIDLPEVFKSVDK